MQAITLRAGCDHGNVTVSRLKGVVLLCAVLLRMHIHPLYRTSSASIFMYKRVSCSLPCLPSPCFRAVVHPDFRRNQVPPLSLDPAIRINPPSFTSPENAKILCQFSIHLFSTLNTQPKRPKTTESFPVIHQVAGSSPEITIGMC